jgi:predicted PurR-regulated permease PerM
VTKSINNTAPFLTGLVATIIFTFLFLIYRTGFTEAFIAFFPKTEKERVLKMFKSIQRVGQSYFLGMLILIILIGFGNSFGLLIIGLDNPFLFGFLGATMSIVPYIGTVVGAIIPISYSFATNESALTALAIAILFWAVQMITDNFLTPKIVGGSVKINALAAILSLIVGASVWGVAGMILFLPFLAMLKVVCQEYETLEPLALLIGDQHQDKDGSESLISKGFKKLKNRISNRHHSIKK